MSIVYQDVNNDFEYINYNGTILPYGITMPILNFTDDDPVSEPCSPREEIEVRPRIIFHGYCWRLPIFIPYSSPTEMKFRQHKFPKYTSKKNMNKFLRKNHKIKQPNGSSCNQRR